MVLFVFYLLLYGGFVFLNAFSSETMELTPLPGVNLAILYGFGLILMAFVLALAYGFLRRHCFVFGMFICESQVAVKTRLRFRREPKFLLRISYLLHAGPLREQLL